MQLSRQVGQVGHRVPPSESLAGRIRFGLLLTVLGACLLGGGASRADVASLLYLRPIVILCIAGFFLTPGGFDFRFFKVPLMLLAGLGVLMVLQLIPLPPSIWQELPGRERYLDAAEAAGVVHPWRPISLTPDLTWNSLLALLPPLAVLVGMASIPRDRSYALLYVLIGFACVAGVLGILQLTSSASSPVFLYKVTHSGSAVGFFANRNHQATLLAMTFPLLRVWTMMPHPDPQWRRSRLWVAAAIGVFLVPMILVTGSRAGVAMGAVAIVAALLMSPVQAGSKRARWHYFRLGAVILVPLLMTGAVLLFGRAIAIQRMISGSFEDDPRFGEMPVIFSMIAEYMPVGTGFGSFEPLFRSFEPDSSLTQRYLNHAHNDLLELAITGGIFALIVLAIVLAWWLRRTIVAFRPYGDRSRHALFARAGSIMVLIVFLASLVDYPLRTPLMSAIFAIAVAWIAQAGLPARQTEESQALP
jgi:hypothetical protein